MKRFSQYSDPVLESHRHRAFNTTVNYTLVFPVKGERRVSGLLCLLLLGQIAGLRWK